MLQCTAADGEPPGTFRAGPSPAIHFVGANVVNRRPSVPPRRHRRCPPRPPTPPDIRRISGYPANPDIRRIQLTIRRIRPTPSVLYCTVMYYAYLYKLCGPPSGSLFSASLLGLRYSMRALRLLWLPGLNARLACPSICELATDLGARGGPKVSLLTAASWSLSPGNPQEDPPRRPTGRKNHISRTKIQEVVTAQQNGEGRRWRGKEI